jgi:hypothetical protein
MRETRTERDLAEALAALERYAPDPDTVLRAVRRRPRRARLGRLAPWRPRPRLILSIAAAAAAAALAIALLPGAGSPGSGRNPRPALPGLPTTASVAKAMLTAFDSVSGDVEYATETGITHGATVDVYQTWSWPAQPVAGQRQIDRTLFSEPSPGSPAVKQAEDLQQDFVTPPASADTTRGQVTMVCFRGTGQTACGWGDTNTAPGTWSRFTAQVTAMTDGGAFGVGTPAALVRGIADGAWRIVGRTGLDGQQAIELRETGSGPEIIEPLPVLLWVNAQTYLPIRLVSGVTSTGVTIEDFSYLPPTAANLAQARVPIPAGYPRSTPER